MTQPEILTVPSTDTAFRREVERLRDAATGSAEDLEARLRLMYPRAVVRRRDISGEPPAWYVYRDGRWRSDLLGSWWDEPGLPRLGVARDGWVVEANTAAQSLLVIDPADLGTRHLTDFVAPGRLEDFVSLFETIEQGHAVSATITVRPTNGEVVAIDLHGERVGELVVAVFRLADDIPPLGPAEDVAQAEVAIEPATDAAFRGYVELALSRMPEPTPDGLALRLRRLYPHAQVAVDGGPGSWIARRDGEAGGAAGAAGATGDGPPGAAPWWADPRLPRVRYDAQALILEANDAACELLGRSLVGHHWQEFVTPGSTEQVSAMLEILARTGGAESRFRMPRADGSLLEFDSWTAVDGDGFTTVMRPRS